ncbi:MAG: type II toxin-antitoxin system VapC family toxin [Nitrospirota bacterium]
MISYLIDTDWIIDFLKGKEKVVARLNTLIDDGLAISIISLAELYEGIYASNNLEKQIKGLNDFLTGVTILGINEEIAKIFGRYRMMLRKEGRLIDNFDLLIAATCLHYDLILVTNNINHFGRIKGLKHS